MNTRFVKKSTEVDFKLKDFFESIIREDDLYKKAKIAVSKGDQEVFNKWYVNVTDYFNTNIKRFEEKKVNY